MWRLQKYVFVCICVRVQHNMRICFSLSISLFLFMNVMLMVCSVMQKAISLQGNLGFIFFQIVFFCLLSRLLMMTTSPNSDSYFMCMYITE